MDFRQRAAQLKTDLPAVLLCMRRRDVPLAAKLCAGITLAYALSPIDLIPDFIPVLGALDDLLVLPALAALTIRLIPKDVFAQCRLQAQALWKDGRPKKWYFAIPVVLVWLAVCLALWRALRG